MAYTEVKLTKSGLEEPTEQTTKIPSTTLTSKNVKRNLEKGDLVDNAEVSKALQQKLGASPKRKATSTVVERPKKRTAAAASESAPKPVSKPPPSAKVYLLDTFLEEVASADERERVRELVSSLSDDQLIESVVVTFRRVLAYQCELIRRFKLAQEEAASSKKSLDAMVARHSEAIQQLRVARDERRKSESQVKTLQVEARSCQLALSGLKEEMATSWVKEEFLKSAEFREIFTERATSYFFHGFNGCLAQLRANGYSEKEHPFSFLDVARAFADIPEEEPRPRREAAAEPTTSSIKLECPLSWLE